MWRMVSRGAECEGYEVPGPNIPGPDSCRDAGTKSPPATDPEGRRKWLRDRWYAVNAIGGALMIALGIMVLTGNLERITQRLATIGFAGL